MMRTIRIDDEVYSVLQQHARPFEDTENDVLRRLLLEDGSQKVADDSRRHRPGDLKVYLDAGLLNVGDELVHEQPRKGVVHRATVTLDGCLVVGGKTFSAVSPALKSSVGHDINGWKSWRHHRSGRLLNELREEVLQMQQT
jgi:hypothetical protein